MCQERFVPMRSPCRFSKLWYPSNLRPQFQKRLESVECVESRWRFERFHHPTWRSCSNASRQGKTSRFEEQTISRKVKGYSEEIRLIMVHGSMFMNSCTKSKLFWLGDVCEYVMKKNRWWGKISQHYLQRCGIWSWRSTASPASWAVPSRSHHECFFSRLVRSKINETPA